MPVPNSEIPWTIKKIMTLAALRSSIGRPLLVGVLSFNLYIFIMTFEDRVIVRVDRKRKTVELEIKGLLRKRKKIFNLSSFREIGVTEHTKLKTKRYRWAF